MASEYDRVLVAGASGRTGREILDVLIDRDLAVQAVTRSSETRRELRDRGVDDVVVGDLLDPTDAAAAVRDCDGVLCAVGSSLRSMVSPALVDGQGVINLAAAAANEGVERFVMESSIGVGNSKAKLPLPFRLLLYRVLKAKGRAERYLATSGPPHTVIRPGGLTDEQPTNDVLVAEGGDTIVGTIPRADVARLMVSALRTAEAERRTFEVVAREGLRGEATGLVDLEWGPPVGEPSAVAPDGGYRDQREVTEP